MNAPFMNRQVLEPTYAWRKSGRTYPAVNAKFFEFLGIGIEPTDEAVDMVCDLMEDEEEFDAVLERLVDDREVLEMVEQLLWLCPGDLIKGSQALRFLVLDPLLDDVSRVLGYQQ